MVNKFNKIIVKLNRRLNSYAVSSTISLLLVLMIFFSATGAVLIWGPNYIQHEGNVQETKSTESQLRSINYEVLNSLIPGGIDSSLTSEMVINSGTIEIDSKGERLIVIYSLDPNWNFNVNGLEDDDNKFSITDQNVDYVKIYWLNSTCFLAGTKISMADGSKKNIEDVKSGDIVRSFDEVSDKFIDSHVIKLLSYSEDCMSSDYYIVINGNLKVTPNHKLFVDNKWITAGEVNVGDVLYDVVSHRVSVFSVVKMFSKDVSFDLLLDSSNTYFANGFLVKSDVEQVDVSDSINIGKMPCVQTILSPLGAEDIGEKHESSGPWHTYPLEFISKTSDYGGDDTFISEAFPWSTEGGQSEHLNVDPQRNKQNRVLVYMPFEESDVPEYSKIINAAVELFYYDYYTPGFNPQGQIHDIYECAEWWGWYTTNWALDEDNYRSNPISSVTIPSSFQTLSWDVTSSIQKYVGFCVIGNPSYCYVPNYDNYFGWYIRDTQDNDDWVLAPHCVKYRSEDWNGTSPTPPTLDINYIAPPVVETEDAINIGNNFATLQGYLYFDGGDSDGADCYFKWGYGTTPYETSIINRYDYGSSFTKIINGLNSGDLVYFRAVAENSAYDDDYGDICKFLTIPPAPTNLLSDGQGTDWISLSWNKGAVQGSGQSVYTKILYKKGSYPTSYNQDQIDPSCESWFGMEDSVTIDNLDPGSTYYFIAYTDVTEGGLWKYSDGYDQCTAETQNNRPPNTPSIPSGPINLNVYESGIYSTFATDPDGDWLQYRFDWDASGSHDYSNWIIPVEAKKFGVMSLSHFWSAAGTYSVKAQVKDPYDAVSPWSEGLTVTVISTTNNRPNTPDTPLGNTILSAGDIGTYTTSANDIDVDRVRYRFDWNANGGHDFSDWTDFVPSGEIASMPNSWSYGGTYSVKAQAQDEHLSTSEWSTELLVTVTGISPPNIPDELGPSSVYPNYYNDTEYWFKVNGTDPNGDDIRYMFDFGDGSYSGWLGPYPSGEEVEAVSHIWDTKGVYEIKVKANNSNGLESDWSDPLPLNNNLKYIIPPDNKFEDCNNVLPDTPGSNTFTACYDLTGSVCIQLFNNNYPSATDPAKGTVSFGIIWIFDLGSLYHSISSESGDYKTILQNGGVLSVLPGGAYVNSYSNIYENGDILGFTVTMLRGDETTAGGGARTYGISLKNLNTFAREQQGYNVYNFKVKISGLYSNAWYDYLIRTYKFTPQSDMLLYNNGNGLQLLFSTALIKINIQ